MWNRLKNSFIAAAISLAIVISGVSASEPMPAAAERSPWMAGLMHGDAEAQVALAIVVQLTALAIDAAVTEARETGRATPSSSAPSSQRSRTAQRLRMPFYSFAPRTPRARES